MLNKIEVQFNQKIVVKCAMKYKFLARFKSPGFRIALKTFRVYD